MDVNDLGPKIRLIAIPFIRACLTKDQKERADFIFQFRSRMKAYNEEEQYLLAEHIGRVLYHAIATQNFELNFDGISTDAFNSVHHAATKAEEINRKALKDAEERFEFLQVELGQVKDYNKNLTEERDRLRRENEDLKAELADAKATAKPSSASGGKSAHDPVADLFKPQG